MSTLKDFERVLHKREHKLFLSLGSPIKIQGFLDRIRYYDEDFYRSPLTVLRKRKACCLDGALFAATALRKIGHPPLIVSLNAENDDDHILAIYKRNGFFGAVAKSNFVGLRFREPVYRTLRELIMTYFESYYNLDGKKTLRSYTVPLNLKPFDKIDWMICDDSLEMIADRLDTIRKVSLITPGMVRRLSTVDKRFYKAGMLGTDTSSIYKPRR